MLDRVLGVFKLDVQTFEEIEADQDATSQAAIVVLVVAVIGALGSTAGAALTGAGGGSSFLATLVGVFLGWIVWSVITYVVGVNLFGGTADVGEMLRVIGFAYAPQVLAIIPCIGWIVGAIWSLIAGFIAVRQGLDLDNTKAFLTILVGFLAYVVFSLLVGMLFGAPFRM